MSAGRGLGEAIEWLHLSGTLTAPLRLWYSEPWVERLRVQAVATGPAGRYTLSREGERT